MKVYKIMVSSKYGHAEEVDSASTKKEANYLVKEYRMAYGPDFWVYIK